MEPMTGRARSARSRSSRCALLPVLLLLGAELPAPARSQQGEPRVRSFELEVESVASKVVITLDGEAFTEYRFDDDAHYPYLYPVIAPGGAPITRHWPMAEAPGEEKDHPHHRSLWFAHGDVGGHDFWTGRDGSRIVHDEVLAIRGGESGHLRTGNRWLAPDGELVARDVRDWRFAAGADWRVIDLEIEIRPAGAELRFGDTKEGTMAIRLAPQLRLAGEVATGRILTSEGVRDGEAWGRRARWVDYRGRLGDSVLGVAIFDHPGNPRHPTWWHARGYGLFAANPFGVHDFESKPAGSGDLVLGADESLRLRYRFLLYAGDWTPERLEDEFAAFAAP